MAGDDDIRAAIAFTQALVRRFFAAQIAIGAADPMEIGRLIDAAAEEASLNAPEIDPADLRAEAHRFKSRLDDEFTWGD